MTTASNEPSPTIKLEYRNRKEYIVAHGWKKWLGSWWYKPIPGWGGRCSPNNQLHNLGSAFKAEHEIQMQQIADSRKAPQ